MKRNIVMGLMFLAAFYCFAVCFMAALKGMYLESVGGLVSGMSCVFVALTWR